MKILVTAKSVVDANIKVKLKEGNVLDVSALKHSMNPFDEIAIEEALQLKKKIGDCEIGAVSIGDSKSADVLRIAYAMGVDRAILVQTDAAPEPLTVAKLLETIVKQEKPDLILCGKQATDNDANQVGQMLAALCDIPQATHASKIQLENNTVQVTREIDGGLETVELQLPAVVTADLRLNSPRYVTLPMMMKAKKRTITTISADTLGVDLASHLEVLGYEMPSKRKTGVILANVDELIEKLKNEANVL
jgi:electron transfer flavoprotein beta subunit